MTYEDESVKLDAELEAEKKRLIEIDQTLTDIQRNKAWRQSKRQQLQQSLQRQLQSLALGLPPAIQAMQAVSSFELAKLLFTDDVFGCIKGREQSRIRREAGLCFICGTVLPLPTPSTSMCQKCLDDSSNPSGLVPGRFEGNKT